MSSLSREEIISLIDSFSQRPDLRSRSDGELMNILVALHSNVYEFKHEHYKFQARNLVNDMMRKERELQIREEEIQKRETRIRDSEFKLRQSKSPETRESNSNDSYVRSPDPVRTECLIGPAVIHQSPPRSQIRYQQSDQDEMDAELREAIRLSEEEEFRVRQAAVRARQEKKEYEDAMAESSRTAFQETTVKPVESSVDVKIDLTSFQGVPADITEEFLVNVYTALKNQDFDRAKEFYNKISGGSCSWLMRLKHGNFALRQKIMSKDPEAYKCIKSD